MLPAPNSRAGAVVAIHRLQMLNCTADALCSLKRLKRDKSQHFDVIKLDVEVEEIWKRRSQESTGSFGSSLALHNPASQTLRLPGFLTSSLIHISFYQSCKTRKRKRGKCRYDDSTTRVQCYLELLQHRITPLLRAIMFLAIFLESSCFPFIHL